MQTFLLMNLNKSNNNLFIIWTLSSYKTVEALGNKFRNYAGKNSTKNEISINKQNYVSSEERKSSSVLC